MSSFNIDAYFWCAVGIAASVLLPILWATLYRYFPKPKKYATRISAKAIDSFWKAIKPYLTLGVASLITALVIVVIFGDNLSDYRAAFLAGYAWDSTLHKFSSG